MSLNNVSKPLTDNETARHAMEVIARLQQLAAEKTAANEANNALILHDADEWLKQAAKRPDAKMLFDEFWREGEVCILFADTNLGKSILAVNIGTSIAHGHNIRGFELEADPQTVLYIDFELSDKQFQKRYSSPDGRLFTFGPNFKRAQLNPDGNWSTRFESYDDYLAYSIEERIIQTQARVLIIDNLTYLKNETEKAQHAAPLMRQLIALKNKYKLSLLCIAHTPKRDASRPITLNDLQGSKMLSNLCDSCFAIGNSNKEKGLRYIKQLKARDTEKKYEGDNVCVCRIDKTFEFLQFRFVSFSDEKRHLKDKEDEKDARIEAAVELKKAGSSNTDIAKKFNVSEGAVRKWLKKAEEETDADDE